MGLSNRTYMILGGAAAVLFASNALLMRQIRGLQWDADHLKRSTMAQLARVRELSVSVNESHHDEIEALTAQLEAEESAAGTAAAKAGSDAERYAKSLARRLARARQQQLTWADGQITSLQAATAAAEAEARRLQDEVQQARSGSPDDGLGTGVQQLAQTLTELQLRANAQRDEIAESRRAAEQETIAIDVKKSGEGQTVGGVKVILRKADRKRNRYTLELVVGGVRIEAADRTVDEPVLLYLAGRQRPLELVIHEVGKDEVRGFLSLPKRDQMAQSYSSRSAETKNFPGR